MSELALDAGRDGITGLAVRVVVAFAAQVLVLKLRDGGNPLSTRWELPCGTAEPDESLVEAAVRVVAEQTGLDVVNVRSFLGSRDGENPGRQAVRQYSFVAEVRMNRPPVVGNRHEKAVWENPDQAMQALSAADQSAVSGYVAGLRG